MPESLVAGQLFSAGESTCAHELDHVARDELDRARVRGESILLAVPVLLAIRHKGLRRPGTEWPCLPIWVRRNTGAGNFA